MKGIHILSTRLILHSLIELAGNAGIYIDQKEFIRTEPSLSPEKAASIEEIPARATLIFTSTNAVEALSRLVHEYNIQIPPHCKAFSVDGRTSTAINTLFPAFDIVATSETAKKLAEEIMAKGSGPLYYICGNLRRDELPALLCDKGIEVTELELYKTYPTPVTVEQTFDGIVFFSPSAASSFFSVNAISNTTICFAIGDTTANAIREYTNNDIVVASRPRQDSIVATIIKHFQSR